MNSIQTLKKNFHRLASPRHFFNVAGNHIGWITFCAALLYIIGLIWGLLYAPPDYQQGNSFRIIYIHVPAAAMSMGLYLSMAICCAIGLIWKIKLSFMIAQSLAIIGATFTIIALVSGSVWGMPTWGTWWAWDARLTSELVLLFLYLGYLGLSQAIPERDIADKASGILAIVGVVNLPIIHYSVIWWNSLHQGSTILKLSKPSIAVEMLWPLLIMMLAFALISLSFALLNTRMLILENRLRNTENLDAI